MAFRPDREKLKFLRRVLAGVILLAFALFWVLNSVSVTPEFLKSKPVVLKKAEKKVVVDEVLKLPPPRPPEKVVTRIPKLQLDRAVRPNMSSSLRGFGEGGSDMAGSFSENGGGVAGRVEEAALERQARLSRRVEPVFPQAARERGLSGAVTLELQILPSGQVGNIKLLESNPPGYFESAAMDAAKKWTFEPAMAAGAPVLSVVIQKMRFDLE